MLTIARRHSWLVTGLLAAACTKAGGPAGDTASAGGTVAENPSAQVMVRGTVASASSATLSITSDSGTISVKLATPVAVYDRQPGSLTDVAPHSFVGVTSVKQPDGSERATEIHVFPDELRGLGEGSHMMSPTASTAGAGGNGNRMTNGAVSGSSAPSSGAAPASRMSNGNVSSTTGSTLVVQYAGGSQTITVPPNTPVTIIKATSKTLSPGDHVVALAQRGADGSLSTQKVLVSGR